MPLLPSPVRAALGLAATVLDEARQFPDKAIELPMRAVSAALKMSLRAQQQYAALAARGDEVLAARSTGDEPPAWATFDDAAEPLDDLVDAPADDPADDPAGIAEVTPVRRPRPAPAGPAAKSVARTRPAAKTARTGKAVHAPRTGKASAFDTVPDDPAE
jgi:hypothetical protein